MNYHRFYPAGDHPTAERVDTPPGFDGARPGSGPTPREEAAAARQHYLDGFIEGYNRACGEENPKPLKGRPDMDGSLHELNRRAVETLWINALAMRMVFHGLVHPGETICISLANEGQAEQLNQAVKAAMKQARSVLGMAEAEG